MKNDSAKYIEREFLSSDELISSVTKTRTLNLISESLDALVKRTNDNVILGLIDGLRYIIEDAYVISMYKFQFKVFTVSLSEEVATITQMVEHAN